LGRSSGAGSYQEAEPLTVNNVIQTAFADVGPSVTELWGPRVKANSNSSASSRKYSEGADFSPPLNKKIFLNVTSVVYHINRFDR